MIVAKLIAASVLIFSALPGGASAQMPEGRVYVLHSPATDKCPSLDWYIVVEPKGILAGMISWNDMNTMARASGTVDQQGHSFAITAVEMGGQAAAATIRGKILNDGRLIADIEGPSVTCRAVIVRKLTVRRNEKFR